MSTLIIGDLNLLIESVSQLLRATIIKNRKKTHSLFHIINGISRFVNIVPREKKNEMSLLFSPFVSLPSYYGGRVAVGRASTNILATHICKSCMHTNICKGYESFWY